MRGGNHWLCLLIALCTTFNLAQSIDFGLNIIKQWTQLEFDYASLDDRQKAIDNGEFAVGQIAPVDVDVHWNGTDRRIFVTVPRFQTGVPVTLGTVSDRELNGNPIITPYPSWLWHQNVEQCNEERLVSVFRVQIDECGRLWVIDTGKILENVTCPAQILAFDLETDQVVHRHEIPSSLLEPRSLPVTIVVDVRDPHDGCQDTFAYIADVQSYSLLVHDVQQSKSWRIVDKTFYPYPNFGTYHIAGDQFDLMDGLLGLALEPYQPGRDRRLFYHAMTSPTENWVYTSLIRNGSRFENNPQSSPEIFHTFEHVRTSQSAVEAIDDNGIMYFGLLPEIEMNCWNTQTDYSAANIHMIADNQETLQFPSGLKIRICETGPQLWFFTTRLQKLLAGTPFLNETNFRILAGDLDALLFLSGCRW